MPFVPGRSGNPKGRPKGAKNRFPVTTREELWSYIAQLSASGQVANPFIVLVDTMMSTTETGPRIACAIALADRLLPKLKAVELHSDPQHHYHHLVQALDKESDARLNALVHPNGTAAPLPHLED